MLRFAGLIYDHSWPFVNGRQEPSVDFVPLDHFKFFEMIKDSEAGVEVDIIDEEVPFISLEVDDADNSTTAEPSSSKQRFRFYRGRRTITGRFGSALHLSRALIWLLKASAGFIAGFLFASISQPFLHWPTEDKFDGAFRPFDTAFDISPHAPDYPTEYMKSVLPIPCHSHNDYWRQRPLYSALGSGCISVEADVWNIGEDLFVAHTMDEVVMDRTLESMYIAPLLELLDHLNPHPEMYTSPRGVFYQNPGQTLVLVVDLKSPDTYLLLQEQIEPLRRRGYLTFWNGADRIDRPVTIVASGAAPFQLITANTTYRDVFYDAPLEALNDCDGTDCPWTGSTAFMYNPSNSYYASSSLVRALGPLAGFALTESQLNLMRQQVRDARERGLVPRYWGTPRWPRGLRDEIWSVLLQSNVGVLNVDDLRAARKGTWGSWPRSGQQRIA